MSSSDNKRIIPHDRAPKSTPSREQLKIDLRLRCERRLRESLADNRRSLMQSRRESGGGGGEDAAMMLTSTTSSTSSLLSPTSAALSSSTSGVDGERKEGQILFSSSSTGPTVMHNMLQEIFADEMMMHTPISDRGGGGGLIRPYRPGGLLLKNGNDVYDNEDDFSDPLSDNELFEMLLEIESSVLRQQEEEDKKAEEEEEEPPPEPDFFSFKGQYGRKQLAREKGVITKFKFTTSEGGGEGGGFSMVDDHDDNEKDEEGEEENDMELLSAQEEQMRKDEEDAYYARLAENND